jgi:hypothetical protein
MVPNPEAKELVPRRQHEALDVGTADEPVQRARGDVGPVEVREQAIVGSACAPASKVEYGGVLRVEGVTDASTVSARQTGHEHPAILPP